MRWRLRQECSLGRADGQPDRVSIQVVDHRVAVFNFTEVTKRGNGLVVTTVMLDVEIREKQGSLQNLPAVYYLVSDNECASIRTL